MYKSNACRFYTYIYIYIYIFVSSYRLYLDSVQICFVSKNIIHTNTSTLFSLLKLFLDQNLIIIYLKFSNNISKSIKVKL